MTTPRLTGIHHVAVNVRDGEAARHFYREIFNLPERPRDGGRGSGTWFILGALELHLQERPDSTGPRTDQHFAVLTDQLEEVARRAVAHGGRFEQGQSLPGFRKRGFLFDPDGNRIELLEP